MYKDMVIVTTSGNSYTVTNNENRYNSHVVPSGIKFYTKDEDFYFTPVRDTEEFYVRKTSYKPSIYKRDWFQCYKDEYKYAFTERTTKTTTTDKDVYYNSDRNRFISKSKVSNRTRTEYGIPSLLVW